jgi:hypothetical protein
MIVLIVKIVAFGVHKMPYTPYSHTARETFQLVYDSFPGHAISHFDDKNWIAQIMLFKAVGRFSLGFLEV